MVTRPFNNGNIFNNGETNSRYISTATALFFVNIDLKYKQNMTNKNTYLLK